MLSRNSKANIWGCNICYNFRREIVEEYKEEEDEEIFTDEESNFLVENGILKSEPRYIGYCTLAHKKINNLTFCPIGL
jgi:hypothetical protein